MSVQGQADREASNAIVAQAAFYAGALARAQGEIGQHVQAIEVLRADKVKRDGELHQARCEGDDLRRALDEVRKQLDAERRTAAEMAQTINIERSKVAACREEIAVLKGRIEQQRVENEQTQRALVESHHERDNLRKQMQASSEALGFLKGQANAFVAGLREILVGAGYTIASPEDVLEAVRDLAVRAGPAPKATSKLPRLKS